MQGTLSRATLGRLPMYLRYIRRTNTDKISATQIAKGLGLGEVQVRKDLASVCAEGLPKVGYPVSALRRDMERALGVNVPVSAVIVGAGKLGSALMEYDGFAEYKYAGASRNGIDCSGLVMYCYAQIGIRVPHGATQIWKHSGVSNGQAPQPLCFASCVHRHPDGSGRIRTVICGQDGCRRADSDSQFCPGTD